MRTPFHRHTLQYKRDTHIMHVFTRKTAASKTSWGWKMKAENHDSFILFECYGMHRKKWGLKRICVHRISTIKRITIKTHIGKCFRDLKPIETFNVRDNSMSNISCRRIPIRDKSWTFFWVSTDICSIRSAMSSKFPCHLLQNILTKLTLTYTFHDI